MEPNNYSIKKQKTESILGSIKNLPMIPKVMFEVTKFLQQPGATTAGLSKLIGKDQGLTTKILSIANSPLYGLQRKVTSLEFAIIVLGFKEIYDIVSAISLSDALKITSDKYFDQTEFWVHSMVVGTAAKSISQNLGFLDLGSDAFVAGMLHDLGIQLLHKFFHQQYVEITLKIQNGNVPVLEAELEILGLTHQQVGKFLSEKWNLPILLCETLNHHHCPSEVNENKILSSIVHLADYMTQYLQVASFEWDQGMQLDNEIVTTLNFQSAEELDKFMLEYKNLFVETASSVRI